MRKGLVSTRRVAFLALLAWQFSSFSAVSQITNPVPGRSISKMLADYLRPRVYALNQGDGMSPGSLLLLDSVTGQVTQELTVNTNPTDMVISPAQDALYIINTGSRTISKVDLYSVQVVSEKPFQTPNPYDQNGPLRIAIGNSNLLYFTDGAWNPNIITYDYDGGTNLALFYDYGSGTGGLTLTHDGSFLYRWAQLGWSAGYAGSWVNRMNVSMDGNLAVLEASTNTLWRDPLDTPVLLDAAERWVFAKQAMLVATNVSVSVRQFANNIYAISLDGSVAFSPTEVLETSSGAVITNLPFTSTVQVLSGDQLRLFRYDAAGTNIVVFSMSGIAQLSTNVIVPTPADGAIVSEHMMNVTWTRSPFAIAYDTYLGTNQTAIDSANNSSAEYLGRSSSLFTDLPAPLVPGVNYYWRVDVVTPSGTNKGIVWSFAVSPILIQPDAIVATSIRGVNAASQNLIITSSLPSVSWTANVNGANWLTLNTNSGGTPDVLELNFTTQSLPVGIFTNSVQIVAGGLQLSIPVLFTNYPLNVVKMIADSSRPYLYLLQQAPASGESGRLLFFNTTNATIEKSLLLGPNPADLTIHPLDGRMYIASWGESNTYVVDLASQSILQSLHLGADVYRINPGGTNRIIVEGYDQWVDISIADTTTSEFKARYFLVREGDGETAPDARAYYHCDNNSSGASLRKYIYTNDNLTQIALNPPQTNPSNPYGTRNLVMSSDGSTLFWNSYAYDSNLNELGGLGAEIYSCSSNGGIAFGSNQVFDTALMKSFYTLPTVTIKSIVENQNGRFWYFSPVSGWIESLTLTNIMSITVTQQPASLVANYGTNVTLTCKVTGFRPGFYWFKDGLPLLDGNGISGSSSNALALSNVWGGVSGSYSVVISNSIGSVTSTVASLTVRDPLIATQIVDRVAAVGQNVNLGLAAVGTGPIYYQWRKGGVELTGSTNAQLTLTNVQLSSGGNYDVVLSNQFNVVTSRLAALYVSQYSSVADSFNPASSSTVSAIAVQPDGKIIIGGSFSSVAGQPRNRLARLNADGTLDYSFVADAGGTVESVIVLEDSKILVGGNFSTLGGAGHTNIGRLNVDGTVDASFNARANSTVSTLAVQADGKILAAGSFASMNGQFVGRLCRLNQDGTLDTNFNAAANNNIFTVVPQADGKILVGGSFTAIGQTNRSFIARLNSNGSADSSFIGSANSIVNSIVVQPNGSILAGGLFTMLGGTNRNFIGRLNPDGSLDAGYNPGANGAGVQILTMALQADSKLLAGGLFNTFAGQNRTNLARLNNDGSVDLTFNPGANLTVSALQIQPDGRIVVGGNFTVIGGQSRSRIARLFNTEDVSTSLDYDGNNLVWTQGGPLPELWRAVCAQSTDGISWSTDSHGVRTNGGWLFPGAGTNSATIRVRGFSSSGEGSSSGIFDASRGAPALAPELSGLTNIIAMAGSNVSFNVPVLGSPPFAFRWLHNGQLLSDSNNIAGSSTSTLIVSNVLSSDAGAYMPIVTNVFGAVTSPPVTLTVVLPPLPLTIDTSSGFTSGQFSFSVNGPSGQTFAIQASTNLQNWTTITSSSFGVGPFCFTNTIATNMPMFFYRLRLP